MKTIKARYIVICLFSFLLIGYIGYLAFHQTDPVFPKAKIHNQVNELSNNDEASEKNKIEKASFPEKPTTNEEIDNSEVTKKPTENSSQPKPSNSKSSFPAEEMIVQAGNNVPWPSLQPAAKRARKIELNKTFLSDSPVFKKGEEITIKPFDDVNIKAKIRTSEKNVLDTVCYIAEIEDSPFGRVYFTCYDQMVLCHITDPTKHADYLIKYNRASNSHYALEVDRKRSQRLAGAHPGDLGLVPPALTSKIAAEVKKKASKADSAAAITKAGGVTIDIMVVYTAAAKSWSDSNEGSINNTISGAVLKANDAHTNTQSGITINLCHSEETTYTETGTGTDLDRLTTHGDGYMDDVTEPTTGLRDTYGADFVTLFEVTSQFGGLGWALTSSSGNEAIAFNLTRVQQASWTYTMIHEFGHNMGCGHSKTQYMQQGPQIWNYSAGWQWDDSSSSATDGYCTVMTYEDHDGNGVYEYSRVGYFSNPLLDYNGKPTGDATDGDNARTLVQMRDILAAYRDSGTTESSGEITIDDITVTEGDLGTVNAIFTVTLTDAESGDLPITINYATAGNTATEGTDYNGTSGTLQFDANGSKTVTVTVNGDVDYEDDETFYLNLSGSDTITDSQGVCTIINDDDPPTVTFSVSENSIAETNGLIVNVDVKLSTESGEDTKVYFAFSGTATETVDYAVSGLTSDSLVIPANNTSASFTISPVDDSLDEVDETIIIDIDSITGGTEDGDQQQTITITDNDDPPTLSIDDVTVAEEGDTGTVDATFTVSLSAESGNDVVFNYTTQNDTAESGSDYVFASGSVTITAGDTSADITIKVNGDTVDEDDETFNVIISNPVNATIVDDTGVCTIIDDDVATFSVNDISIIEGDTGTKTAQFTISLSSSSEDVLTVDYATANGTAIAGTDYTAVSGTATFDVGKTSITVDVPIIGDLTEDGDEIFYLRLSNPTIATILDSQGECKIIDNEVYYTLTYTAGSYGSITGDASQTVKMENDGTAVTAVPEQYFKFSKWSDGSTDNPRQDTYVTADISVTATFELDDTLLDHITQGTVEDVVPADIPNIDVLFAKKPRFYGQFIDPLKEKDKKANCKTLSYLVSSSSFEWKKGIKLYDQKELLTAQKAGTTTAEWIAENPMIKVLCDLYAVVNKEDGSKVDTKFASRAYMPPQITSVVRWDGGDTTDGIHFNSLVLIKGKYFGTKLPQVSLEYTDTKGRIKLQRLKVQKILSYADSKGRAEKSCMDVSSGESKVYVEMPEKLPLAAGDYTIVLDNKTAIATTELVFLEGANNTDPVANDDTPTLNIGERYYLIDVLANDEDAESDYLELIPGGNTSLKGGKISVKDNKIKYIPPKDQVSVGFKDYLYYIVDDGHGQPQEALVTITMQ